MSAVAERAAPTRPRRRECCPACGTPGRFGQLICLGCGERMALSPRGAPSRRPFLIVAGLMIATGIAALVMVIEGIGTRDDTRPVSDTRTAAEERALDRAAERADRRRRIEARARRQRLAAAAGTWPAQRSAFTVVLANTGDRGSASTFAKTVTNAGDDAGVIASNNHPNLGSNLFMVFSGLYESESEAALAAARLGESYQGAYPQYVEAPKP